MQELIQSDIQSNPIHYDDRIIYPNGGLLDLTLPSNFRIHAATLIREIETQEGRLERNIRRNESNERIEGNQSELVSYSDSIQRFQDPFDNHRRESNYMLNYDSRNNVMNNYWKYGKESDIEENQLEIESFIVEKIGFNYFR